LSASPIRIAYLASAPIIYQVPLLRRLATEPNLSITTFFCSDISLKSYDAGFGRNFKWDIPLLGGYHHEFLPALGSLDRVSVWRPFNYGLGKRLRVGRFQVLWIHGYMRAFNLAAIAVAKRLGIKVLIRDEATQISARRGVVRRIMKRALLPHWDSYATVSWLSAVSTANTTARMASRRTGYSTYLTRLTTSFLDHGSASRQGPAFSSAPLWN